MTTLPPVAPIIPVDQDPSDARSSAWEKVADARTRTLDAKEGFQKMAEHAEPAFAPIVEAFLDLHTRHGDQLTRLLADAGVAPQDDGSFMGTVNRMVVATRAFFDDIDADVLRQIHSGEEHVLRAYDEAMSSDIPAEARSTLSQLSAELKALLADTRPVA